MQSLEILRALDTLATAEELDLDAARKLAPKFETLVPRILLPRTAPKTKELKERALELLWVLEHASTPAYISNLRSALKVLKPQWDELVRAYGTSQGAPDTILLDGVTYKDDLGMAPGKLQALAKQVASVWSMLQGWRRKALRPGLTVVFAGPASFSGSVSGVYRQVGDQLLVRATSKILGRQGYASVPYILLHELGHRYEKFFPLPSNFDLPEWWTTPYSKTDGLQGTEAFAELFALGAMDIRGAWDPVLNRFETLMTGQARLARIVALFSRSRS